MAQFHSRSRSTSTRSKRRSHKTRSRSQSSSQPPTPSLINNTIDYLNGVKKSSSEYLSKAIQKHGKKGIFMLIACMTVVALYKLIQTNYGNIISEKFLEYSSYLVEYSMTKMSWTPTSVQKIIVKLHNSIQSDPSTIQHILPTLPNEVQQASKHFITLPETSSFLTQFASMIGSVTMTTIKYSAYTVLAGVIGTFLLITKLMAEAILFGYIAYFYRTRQRKRFYTFRKFANVLYPILGKRSQNELIGYNAAQY